MSSNLSNLGDYGIMPQIMRQSGGSLEVLFDQVGKKAVERAAPGIFLEGKCNGIRKCVPVMVIFAVANVGALVATVYFYSENKQLKIQQVKNEQELLQLKSSQNFPEGISSADSDEKDIPIAHADDADDIFDETT
ncbi:MAG: hypothetical protein LUC87_05860 [Clostridiales bacterium]|nr:hypothetical protein [Clostridiales bacterium]